MDLETKVSSVLQKVLDIKQAEIKPDICLSDSLGVDSTEMVEIIMVLKKELGIQIKDNELKKSQSFDEIVGVIKAKL